MKLSPRQSFWQGWGWRVDMERRGFMVKNEFRGLFAILPLPTQHIHLESFIMIHLNNQSFGCLLWIVNLSTSEQLPKQLYDVLCALLCSSNRKDKKKKKSWDLRGTRDPWSLAERWISFNWIWHAYLSCLKPAIIWLTSWVKYLGHI